jgi:NAD(P)-dependent dehydrogenase (short-subunit alcohol dehydrogenase family)
MTIELDLSGRRALVTGAGDGVGRAIAIGLGNAGAEVVVNDLDPTRAEAVVGELRALGTAASAAVFDVSDWDAVRRGTESLAGVDVLVNNAGNAGVEGFGTRRPFAQTDPADWQPFLAVNLYGVLHCCRAVLPGMIANGWGRLITIVSDAGRTGDAGGAAYSAAKAGAAGLTRSLALENGRYGITANNLSLGTMRTPATEAFWQDASPEAEAILRDYVVRRPGDPADVAQMVVHLASDHASWITGQTYPLNGGYSFGL